MLCAGLNELWLRPRGTQQSEGRALLCSVCWQGSGMHTYPYCGLKQGGKPGIAETELNSCVFVDCRG